MLEKASTKLSILSQKNGKISAVTLPGGRDLQGRPILLINITGYTSRLNIVDKLQYLLSIFRLV